MKSENLSLSRINKEVVVRQSTIFYGEMESADHLVFLLVIGLTLLLDSL
jgi:hypothetical protein